MRKSLHEFREDYSGTPCDLSEMAVLVERNLAIVDKRNKVSVADLVVAAELFVLAEAELQRQLFRCGIELG